MTESTAEASAASGDFDLYGTGMSDRWIEVWQDLQAQGRAVYSGLYGGYYTLTRYEDVAAAAKDDETFSSLHDVRGASKGEQGIVISNNPMFNGFIELDPPESKLFRGLVARCFTPAALAPIHERMKALTSAAVDRVIESGRIDLVMDYAKPITTVTTLLLMGVDLEDWETYSDAFHRMVYLERGANGYDEVLNQHAWILQKLADTVQDRRANPRDDNVSRFCDAELSPGRKLTDQDIIDTLYLFLGGGLNTTVSLMAHTFMWLNSHPEERRRLIEDRSLIGHACEEFLRFCTPTQGLARTVTRECEFAGRSFKAGDRVLLSWASANVDPEAFPEPEQLELDRHPNRHLAWGIGSHKCIGLALARVEFETMLNEVLDRLPDFDIDTDNSRPFPRIGLTNGYISMPATFTPGKPVGADRTDAQVVWPEPSL